jgi:glycosyltransferase involved in cell wall biosynthesis
MRIGYVCLDHGIPVFGSKGASVHVQELVRAYRRLGHEVVLVTARLGGDPPADLADLEVVEVGPATRRSAAGRELAAVAIDGRTEVSLRRRDDLDVIHERYSLWGGAGVRAAAHLGVPSILEVNAPLIDEQRAHRELVHDRLATARLVATVRGATTATAVSDPVATWVRDRAPGSEVHVVPNGVDTGRFHPPSSHPARPFTVGFVGTLKPWHGVERLVDAVAELRRDVRDARLLIVGDGPRRTAIEAATDAADVPLTCTGGVDPAQVPALLHEMDVACAPYPDGADAAYFSPLKVLEYLAAGVPVVASRTGQLPQLLDHGRCGVLVTPGDTLALAGALRDLARDPGRRRNLARAGRATVVAEHRWDHVAAVTLDHALQRPLDRIGATS